MKTTTDHNRASKIAAAICAALVFGTGIWAQPNPGVYRNNVDEAFNRIEALITNIEQVVKYVAPSVNDQDEDCRAQQSATSEELAADCIKRLDMLAAATEKVLKYEAPSVADDEINSAFERLEMLASNIENEIRYRVPDEEQVNAVEYASNDNDQETDAYSDSDAEGFLSLNFAKAGNK
jgi:ElaB/YqjD/DUF883 family membrane-anchored ribosome-binding protein